MMGAMSPHRLLPVLQVTASQSGSCHPSHLFARSFTAQAEGHESRALSIFFIDEK